MERLASSDNVFLTRQTLPLCAAPRTKSPAYPSYSFRKSYEAYGHRRQCPSITFPGGDLGDGVVTGWCRVAVAADPPGGRSGVSQPLSCPRVTLSQPSETRNCFSSYSPLRVQLDRHWHRTNWPMTVQLDICSKSSRTDQNEAPWKPLTPLSSVLFQNWPLGVPSFATPVLDSDCWLTCG